MKTRAMERREAVVTLALSAACTVISASLAAACAANGGCTPATLLMGILTMLSARMTAIALKEYRTPKKDKQWTK